MEIVILATLIALIMGVMETSHCVISALRKTAEELTSRSISDVILFTCSSWRLGGR
jgi:hypothetical protein